MSAKMYHGSHKALDIIEARPHYLAQGKKVVFATPYRDIALAFLAPWKDQDIDFGRINKGKYYLSELKPNIFEKVFKGVSGYIHTLSPKNFVKEPQLWGPEKISYQDEPVLNIEFIPDILKSLKGSSIGMKFHPKSTATLVNKVASAFLKKSKLNIEVSQLMEIPFSNWPWEYKKLFSDLLKSDTWKSYRKLQADDKDILNWFRWGGWAFTMEEWLMIKRFLFKQKTK